MSTKLWNRLDKEAAELWKRPRAEVRQQLIVHYMPFAEQLATRRVSRNRKISVDEAASHAYEALIKAVDAFDPNNAAGASFTTYAGWPMRGATHEAERDNDHVNHKSRAADKELRRKIASGEVDINTDEGWSQVMTLLPAVGHFADEHTGKRRAENNVPDRDCVDETEASGLPDLAAEMKRWPEDIREAVELLLDCGWDVEEFIRRVYGPDSTVSEALLWRCGPQEKAVKFLKSVLRSIGAEDATISKFGVKEMPAVEVAPCLVL